ncbi:MAG: helix-turn-helix domain-containing protein [Oscillospiraceae bacterium]|jgi:transcriptional regulator with XRE-family HTH domain|nr:helix-turn-helix domain-containing protein [Oscillospiraceae bacterium]
MAFHIGGNIKKLRAEKGVTQEQLAARLSVTCQSVSKWENNVTSPDLYLLPAIADYFETSIDELFQPNMQGYKNKAERLLALYEHRRTTPNFVKANAEFEKLTGESKADADDYRNFGILNQFHAKALNQKAEEYLEKAIEMGNENAEGQLRYLLESLGRHQENIDKSEEAVHTNPERARNWQGLIVSYAAVDPEKALATAAQCLEKFPGDGGILFWCGKLCSKLQRFGEAEAYFMQAIEINPDGGSSYYHMAFMYTETKEYEKAIWAWEQVIALCGRLGQAEEQVEMETEWPKREIAKLRALIEG